MKRWWMVVGVVVVIGILGVLALLVAPKSPVPAAVEKQLSSTLIVPNGNGIVMERDSVKYDKANKLLTFVVRLGEVRLTVSEQPSPEQFEDIPQVYDKVVEEMNTYKSFETAIGKVFLTRPVDLKGKQAAVMNSKGTLLFAKPDRELTEDQWRRFFNSLDVER